MKSIVQIAEFGKKLAKIPIKPKNRFQNLGKKMGTKALTASNAYIPCLISGIVFIICGSPLCSAFNSLLITIVR